MVKRTSIIILLVFIGSFSQLFSQSEISIRGNVSDKKTGEPVSGAAVNLKEVERWTVCDADGNFEFKGVQMKTYTIQIQCLCYEAYNESFQVIPDQFIHIDLIPTSYDMQEVNVLAKKGSNITTTTKIGSAAIEHLQATGLNDIMQLLPGNIADNPDMSGPQQISIREIGTDNNTAMGTAIMLDNAPISNDANLQVLSTSTSASRDGEFNSVAGGGVDLRQISTDNIESVEVIKGIPSVIYGDMTSGAVIINTKAGYSPLNIRLKTDPKIKQAAITKGIKIPNTSSFLNFNLDYLSSFSDVTSKYQGYKRLTGQTAYSTTFLKSSIPLTLNAKLNIFGTVDNTKTDPDAMVAREEYESKDQGIRFNLGGKWSLNKKFITELTYTFSSSYTHQESYQQMYRTASSGVAPLSLSLEEGENIGIYVPTEQLSELTIDGKPVDVYAQIRLNKVLELRKGIINKTLIGGEYRFNGNYGEGQIYDINNPPFISSHSSRPRSFKDIPAVENYSIFIENKIIIPIKSTKLNIQTGTRLNNYQPENIFNSGLGFYLEPRFNIQYNILNNRNNDIFELLAINAGIGKTYKAPSLLYMYPDKAYYDLTVLDYYTDDAATRMTVFNSMIFNTENPDLKPYENLKREVGMDFHVGPVSGNITAFKENLTNGFSKNDHYEFIDGYKYDATAIPLGEKPDLTSLPIEYYDYIISYSSPVNDRESQKSGIEFRLNFGKVKPLYTSFTLDGAYLKTTRVESTIDYEFLPQSARDEQFENIGLYPAGESRVSERFNTNLRMVTQIPQLRMILSTTLQMIWFEKYYYPDYDEAPLYLFDKDGNITDYTDEMRSDPDYMKYFKDKDDPYWLKEILPPLFLANIRLSKEIEDKMKLSLFVNNFFNYRPMFQYIRSESYVRRNQSIYFGAEIKFSL